jgi:hypothetical protein
VIAGAPSEHGRDVAAVAGCGAAPVPVGVRPELVPALDLARAWDGIRLAVGGQDVERQVAGLGGERLRG